MGRFPLAIAQGIEAQAVVRHGYLQTELATMARELEAKTIILGHPRGAEAVFDDEALRAFAAELQSLTSAQVLVF
jgi:hypothetical protein